MMTMRHTTLRRLLAPFLPTSANNIEPAAAARTVNDIDEILLRNVGKYDEKIFTFSACGEEGFDSNVTIHKTKMKREISKRSRPTIENPL
jgi:hypothetical protein